MTGLTIVQASPASWVAYAAPLVSAFSFLLAAWAFVRSSRVAEFQHCTELSEQIDEKWEKLHATKKAKAYRAQLIDILNHYERCATFLNDFKLLRGRPMKNLEHQIMECLERNWCHEYVRETFRDAQSSETTYCELKTLMKRRRSFRFT